MSSKLKCSTEKQRLNTRQKIIEFVAQGMSIAKIAKTLGCSKTLVSNVKRELRAEQEAKPVTRETLEPGAVIAGENFLAKNLPKELVQSDCLNCLRPMWTRDPELENLCEECNYQLMLEAAEAQTRRDVPKISNAFEEANEIGTGMDFPGDIFKLF